MLPRFGGRAGLFGARFSPSTPAHLNPKAFRMHHLGLILGEWTFFRAGPSASVSRFQPGACTLRNSESGERTWAERPGDQQPKAESRELNADG